MRPVARPSRHWSRDRTAGRRVRQRDPHEERSDRRGWAPGDGGVVNDAGTTRSRRFERIGDEVSTGLLEAMQQRFHMGRGETSATSCAWDARSTHPTALPLIENGCACTSPASRWIGGAIPQAQSPRRSPRRPTDVELRRARGRARSPRARRARRRRRSGTCSARRVPANPAYRARRRPNARPRAGSSLRGLRRRDT